MRSALWLLVMLGLAGEGFATPKTATLEVKGWTCGSCAAATKISLKKLDGVQEVSTDLEKSSVRVTYDDTKITPARMVSAVEAIGYKASLLETPSMAQTSAPAPRQAAPVIAEPVTVFDAPLGCPAVDGLGCGSLAKPLLLELERRPQVAEAWLNHSGTVVAVVWKKPSDAPAGRAAVESVDFQKLGTPPGRVFQKLSPL